LLLSAGGRCKWCGQGSRRLKPQRRMDRHPKGAHSFNAFPTAHTLDIQMFAFGREQGVECRSLSKI
jgi:hypothetical protein